MVCAHAKAMPRRQAIVYPVSPGKGIRNRGIVIREKSILKKEEAFKKELDNLESIIRRSNL